MHTRKMEVAISTRAAGEDNYAFVMKTRKFDESRRDGALPPAGETPL